MAKEIVIKEVEFKNLPELKLRREEKEMVDRIIKLGIDRKFHNIFDMSVIYVIVDTLRDLGLSKQEVASRVAHVISNKVKSFTSPILVSIKGKTVLEDEFKPSVKKGLAALPEIDKNIDELTKNAKEIKEGKGFFTVVTDERGNKKYYLDFGKLGVFQTRDALPTHIQSRVWTPLKEIPPLLVYPRIHETSAILKILGEAIKESK
jgi:hypothetical protein